ncbi:hypothetical protein DFS34DRAFT_626969 [Phlyctochytrium arcticum]|nr:hypothetical protein DFS34DRAFT_626969 [Phlyctochytrium arcticum]
MRFAQFAGRLAVRQCIIELGPGKYLKLTLRLSSLALPPHRKLTYSLLAHRTTNNMMDFMPQHLHHPHTLHAFHPHHHQHMAQLAHPQQQQQQQQPQQSLPSVSSLMYPPGYHHHPHMLVSAHPHYAPASSPAQPPQVVIKQERRSSPPSRKITTDEKLEKEMLRKVSHSAIERRRRERINDKIMQLKGLVPACADQENLHKLSILQNAIEYIRVLKDELETTKAASVSPPSQPAAAPLVTLPSMSISSSDNLVPIKRQPSSSPRPVPSSSSSISCPNDSGYESASSVATRDQVVGGLLLLAQTRRPSPDPVPEKPMSVGNLLC